MGNGSGQGRGTSLPPELDAIDSGWGPDPSAPKAAARAPGPPPRTGQTMALSLSSAPPPPFETLRPSERVTARPPPGTDTGSAHYVNAHGATERRRRAETDRPSAGPSSSPIPRHMPSGLELEGEDEDDDIFDRPTEDVFDRPTLDVRADELAFAQDADGDFSELTASSNSSVPRADALPSDAPPSDGLELELAPVHPSALPTAPPPQGFGEDVGRLRALPRTSGAAPAEVSFGARATARVEARPSLAIPGGSFGPPSGLDLADGADVGPAPERSPSFAPEVSTLSSSRAGGPRQEMKDRFAMGDFSGALERAEALIGDDPTDREAEALAKKCRNVLVEMYSSRIAGLDRPIRVLMAADQVRWLSLDHRSGFLLSMIDGRTSVDELLDVCGMQRLDAMRILCSLLDQDVIELG